MTNLHKMLAVMITDSQALHEAIHDFDSACSKYELSDAEKDIAKKVFDTHGDLVHDLAHGIEEIMSGADSEEVDGRDNPGFGAGAS